MINLTKLDLGSTNLKDISVLRSLTKLQELDLYGNKEINISPL